MKITAILLTLLPSALALPLAAPANANADVAARDVVPSSTNFFAVQYRRGLVNDPQERATPGPFAVTYKKDLISDPQKRATPGPFAVTYKKDVIDSTDPAANLEKREAIQPAGLLAVS